MSPWTRKTVLEFIDLLESEPCIWNPKCILNKNKSAVKEAWIRIKNAFSGQCSVNELKRKRNSLLTRFRECVKKTKESAKTDSEYKAIWFAFEPMRRYLGELYECQHNMLDNETVETVVFELCDESREEEDDEPTKNLQFIKETDSPRLTLVTAPSPSRPHLIRIPQKRGSIYKSSFQEKRSRGEVLNQPLQCATNVESAASTAECQAFANYVASKLSQYSTKTRNALQLKIGHLLYEADSGQLEAHDSLCSSGLLKARSNSKEDVNDFSSRREYAVENTVGEKTAIKTEFIEVSSEDSD